MKMNFYCPDFYHGFNIYRALLSLKKNYPNVFRDNVNISHIFGIPYNSIWNGGGYTFSKMPKVEELETCAQYFYDEKIHLQLTFTNALLEKTDCYDRYSNAILDIFNNEYNEILITSPILEEYLRDKPNLKYKFDRSIIAANGHEKEDYNKELKKYNRVVMSRCHSEDEKWLESINPEWRNRVEILVNERCPVSCPRLHTHYYKYAKKQLFESIPPYEQEELSCTNKTKKLYSWEFGPNQYIYTYDEILNKYIPLGYSEFKISGRGDHYNIIRSIIPYLIKEKYQIEVFYFLLKNGVPSSNN